MIVEELEKEGLTIGDNNKYKEDMASYKVEPIAVVIAKSTEDVVKAVKIARKYKVPIIPWGAGTSVTGALAGKGLIIDVSSIRFFEFDDVNWVVHVGVGVVVDELNSFLRSRGFFFPPDPASSFLATVGGCVANGAGGMRCVRYGTFRDWVLSLRVVLADGSVVRFGEALGKNRAGYDLVRLFVGSEGTLGIITEVWLRVIPLPDYKVFRILAYFNDEESVARAIIGIRRERILPEIAEYMDFRILDALKTQFRIEVKGKAALLIDVPEYQLNKLLKILNNLADEIKIAESEEEKEELYKARAYAYLAVKSLGKALITEDIVVPIDKLLDAIRKIRELERKYNIIAPTVGHIGDGNLHPIIMYDEEQKEDAIKFFEELCNYAISIGGSISGEHGIGIQKAKLLETQILSHNGRRVLEIMREIKRLFDPENIMNPGKYISYQ
ncbi:MAG: FAD-linked oxidase C-terminal domain-containing protein [Sulfolobaceae archaeon]